jgi:chromate transporter
MEGRPPSPSFGEALRFWAKLGCISFGGPAGQIALMHQELVERRRWLSERRFLHALNYCMLLPGPEAQQLATYLGWLLHRTAGGIAAGALFVLPSFVLIVVLAWAYLAFGETPLAAGIIYGIKPAVVAIVAHAAWRIGGRTLRNGALWAIAGAAFIALFVLDLPFPAIVAGAALAGTLGGRLAPQHFAAAGHAGKTAVAAATAVIDDTDPPPAHARFTPRRLLAVAGAGLALWALSLVLLAAAVGPGHTLAQMGWFFTKAALLTFGGAYAVLPYVHQGAVEHYGWISATQMIDGLALGETTPGPLIMVVAFVGFLGGWGKALFGPEALFLAGALAAAVATWFTFLPSFVFILAGGPLVESTHGDLRFGAPLTAVTAAVVGVIANLALFFAGHVLWPKGAGFDPLAAAIAAGAALALFRFKAGAIPVIAGCATLGLLARFLA